ncbi:hypothetical protein WR25_16052 [Diploscapter pachys]|uniref:SLC26A/SulP transporter domain-containing protein n=1 Tax=Diploscapter pachys TaxID=2018661 RepID=A0A2A2KJ19_9BILA|nr:hypothetical protein WR25_16052 [Diploscapter pachys]
MIGGITVGIISVPQGMAYASLAGLRPVNGLYTSLFPPLIYMIFGTSRHISLGVFAVVSLMVGSCNLRVTELLVNAKNNGSNIFNPDSDENLEISIAVVTSLALLVGVIQIAMALLRLDFLTDYLSIQMIFGAILSECLNLNGRYHVKIIGKIPTGLPLPSLPDPSLFTYFVSDAMAIAVVVLVTTVSMGKLMASKHGYDIDVRQNLPGWALDAVAGWWWTGEWCTYLTEDAVEWVDSGFGRWGDGDLDVHHLGPSGVGLHTEDVDSVDDLIVQVVDDSVQL